jgi:(p)ppGpp synthase/HD superfamily hydrolase
LIKKATAFATAKHAGQVRKFTGEPYIVHPLAVAELVASTGAAESVVAAAVLHDVLEDTDTGFGELAETFGVKVAKLIAEVTNHFRSATGRPRAERKANELARLANVSADAQTIKVADIIDNCSTLAERSPSFAAVYFPEKAGQLAVLTKADAALLEKAKKIFAPEPDF